VTSSHLDGVLLIDKPIGMTSHDVVSRLRKLLNTKKIGHAGTLDPDATGILVVAVGRGTRLLRFAQNTEKTYIGKIHFGAQTFTLDSSGVLLNTFDMSQLSEENIISAMDSLTGHISQLPPMVSSVKVNGKRLHRIAREGNEVERKPREIEVMQFSLLDIDRQQDQGAYFVDVHSFDPYPTGPTISVRVTCSTGTYIRSLADDLGKILHGGAFLSDLRRINSGNFNISETVSLDDVTIESLQPITSLVDSMEKVTVPMELVSGVSNGKILGYNELSLETQGPWVLLSPEEKLLGVYERYGDESIKPVMVLSRNDDI